MVSFLVDMDTGNPVLDVNTGLLILVDDETAVRQIIFMLLNCQPGSELLHPYYGFDSINISFSSISQRLKAVSRSNP